MVAGEGGTLFFVSPSGDTVGSKSLFKDMANVNRRVVSVRFIANAKTGAEEIIMLLEATAAANAEASFKMVRVTGFDSMGASRAPLPMPTEAQLQVGGF